MGSPTELLSPQQVRPQPCDPDDDQVDRDNDIQQARDQKDQNPGDKRDDWLQEDDVERHRSNSPRASHSCLHCRLRSGDRSRPFVAVPDLMREARPRGVHETERFDRGQQAKTVRPVGNSQIAKRPAAPGTAAARPVRSRSSRRARAAARTLS